MSTDGTKPPSITPKKSARGPQASGARSGAQARGATTTEAPSTTTNGMPDAPGEPRRPASPPVTGDSPSIGDRLKRVGQSVTGAAQGGGSRKQSGDRTPTATGSAPQAPAAGPRRVRLAVAKVDPWSVMKLSFLLSVAVGIMLVVAAAVIWQTLDGQAVFTQLDDTITEITGNPEFFDVLEVAAFDRVLSLATVIAVIDIVLLTALATIGAFLYNIVAALVGGVHLTLTDD